MLNSEAKAEITISILITVVSGKETTRRCLMALQPQIQTTEAEIIVPYDAWVKEVAELKVDFPKVHFHLITDLGIAAYPDIPAHQHRLCDRRRAIGLGLSRGRVIAMTEDQVIPAPDWVGQILTAHRDQPHGVIGGSIDNAIDHPMHWATYYCDHGRYGSPLQPAEAEYVSDLNISYKREVMEDIREVWREAYSETTVHWALRDRGVTLWLDPALKVYKHRPPITLWQAYRERIEWGRVFAETRVANGRMRQRLFFAAISPLLPSLLLIRVLKHMRRQRRPGAKIKGQIIKAVPLAAILLTGWALGEFIGYCLGDPQPKKHWPKRRPKKRMTDVGHITN